MASDDGDRKALLKDLKVSELKIELDKRNLDKTGNKSVLVRRLQEALESEGCDPSSYIFTIDYENGTPVKGTNKSRKSTSKVPSNVEYQEGYSASNEGDEREMLDDGEDILKEALDYANDERNYYPSTFPSEESCSQANDVDGRSNENTKAILSSPSRPESREEGTSDGGQRSTGYQSGTDGHDNGGTLSTGRSVTSQEERDSLIVHVDDTRDLYEDLDESEVSVIAEVGKGTTSSSAGKKESTKGGKEQKDSNKKSEKKDDKHDGKESKGSKSGGKSSSTTDAKTHNESTSSANAEPSDRDVWVSGLSEGARASDLQAVFRKYGKVVAAKIITNTKNPGSGYFGLMTMETKEQAQECINKLNKTDLQGKTILVEKNRPIDSTVSSSRKESDKDKDRRSRDRAHSRDKTRKERDRKDRPKRRSRSPERRRSRSRSPRLRGPPRGFPSRGRGPPRPPYIPGRDTRISEAELRRIEQERIIRRRERIMREQEMRRRMDDERRQREVEREREQLRIERERLEKEKAELLRLERERARLERERIEREKEEVRRRLAREDDLRRGPPPPTISAPIGPVKRSYDDRDLYWDKRAAMGDGMSLPSRVSYESAQSLTSASVVPARFDAYDSRGPPTTGQDRFTSRPTDAYRDARGNGRSDSSRHPPERDDRRTMTGMSSYYDRGQGRVPSTVIGPGSGSLYAPTSSAPLGPASVVHQGAPTLGPQSMDRPYVHSSVRRF